jgi:hypothetical protein
MGTRKHQSEITLNKPSVVGLLVVVAVPLTMAAQPSGKNRNVERWEVDSTLAYLLHLSDITGISYRAEACLVSTAPYRPTTSTVKVPGIIGGLGLGRLAVAGGVSPNCAVDR